MSISFLCNSYEETFNLGFKVAAKKIELLKNFRVFLLKGELGSGKTTFVRGFCAFFGLDSIVNSPTFTIMNVYSSSAVKIYHIDLYRIRDPLELQDLGLDEIDLSSDYCFIEWPELVEDYSFSDSCKVIFEFGDNELQRKISFNL